jgi:hypothetical protein
VKVWLALIVLLIAGVPAFAQTDSDTNGKGTSHGFAVSDGDTVKVWSSAHPLVRHRRAREGAALR